MRKPFVGPATLVVGLILATLVAGCGGGGSAKPTSTPTTVAGDTRTGQSSDEYCGLIRTYSARLAGLSQASSTPAQIRSFAEELSSAIKSAIAVAPAEVKADTTVIAGAADDYLAALRGADYDLAKLPPDAAQVFQAPDVAAAAGRLQIYSHDVCGSRS